MCLYTEVCKIIEASQSGDRARAAIYARLLADNLRKEGKPKDADRVLRALGDLPPGPAAVLDQPAREVH